MNLTAQWSVYFERLVNEGRAGVPSSTCLDSRRRRRYWVAAERARSFAALFPSAVFEQTLADVESGQSSRDDALLTLVTGWMSHLGPVTASQLGESVGAGCFRYREGFAADGGQRDCSAGKLYWRCLAGGGARATRDCRAALDWTAGGGCPHTSTHETEWCERRLLARIHRLTVGMLRKQIEPVTAAAFMRWLMRWQHVAPGTQVAGERGTLEVLQQLQGFEIPANAWERQVLARRIADYDPKWLDQLCLTGAVGWGRLSPHPATVDSAGTANGNGCVVKGQRSAAAAAGDSDQRCADYFFCARRSGLDDSAARGRR